MRYAKIPAVAMAVFSSLFLLGTPSFAQNKIEADDISHHPFETDFPSDSNLTLHIRSADIHILGAAENKITVHISGSSGAESTNIRARFERNGNSGDLDVSGGPHDQVTIEVHVPQNTNLWIRIPAGDVEVKGITGDKDVSLRAGDLQIAVGDPASYAHVEASVTSGDIEAAPFGESHGGLFRSFEKSGNGKYKLVARLWAGDLILK
jgi:hypothetical protein